jgi:hypothetical protein
VVVFGGAESRYQATVKARITMKFFVLFELITEFCFDDVYGSVDIDGRFFGNDRVVRQMKNHLALVLFLGLDGLFLEDNLYAETFSVVTRNKPIESTDFFLDVCLELRFYVEL